MSILVNTQTGLAEDLPEDQANEALSIGSHQPPLISPDNDTVTVPYDQMNEYLSKGYSQPSSDQLKYMLRASKFNTGEQQVKAGVEGAGTGAFGPAFTAAELAAGVKGSNILGREEFNPGINKLTSIGGLAASALSPYGMHGVLGAAGDVGAGLIGATAESGRLIKGLGSAARLGAETALLQSGDEATHYLAGDPDQTSENALSRIGLSGLYGGIAGGVFGQVLPLWKVSNEGNLTDSLSQIRDSANGNELNPVIKKALSTFGGVSEHNIDAYMADRNAINSVPEFQEIYDHALDHVESVYDNLSNKRIDADQAESDLSNLKSSLKDQLKQRGFDASVADKMARMALKNAQTDMAMKLQDNAMNMGEPIANAVEGLRQKVFEGSYGAFDTLSKEEGQVPLSGFFDKASSLQEELKSKGTIESRAMADRLGQYADNVKMEYGSEARPAGVKLLIQGLDGVSKYDYNASSFDKGLSPFYKQLRFFLDDKIKTMFPAYRDAMAPVAADSQLLRSLSDYGTEEDAVRRLKSIKNPDRYKIEMPILKQLEDKMGVNLTHQIEPYANPELRKNLLRSLPQYAESEKTAAVLRALKNPQINSEIDAEIRSTPEYLKSQRAQEELASAIAQKESLNGITPAGLQGKLRTATRGNIQAEKAISQLPEYEGKNLNELMRLRSVKEAFEKGAMNGSRNVNLYGGILGAVSGALIGHPFQGVGLGAGVGATVDRYGPAVVKKILDSYLDTFGDVSKLTGESSPSALRLGLSKVIDSVGPISGAAFKNMVNMYAASEQGKEHIDKSTKAVFKDNDTLQKIQPPSDKQRDKLKKKLNEISQNPSSLLNVTGDLGQYLPQHNMVISSVASRAASYLQSIKPSEARLGPLDPPREWSQAETSRYNRALDIADEPMLVVKSIKNHSITPEDVVTFKSIFPNMYNTTAQGLTEAMIDHVGKGETIPYATRLSLSLFLGQSLDSTMTPQAILSAQPKPAPTMAMGQPGAGKQKHSMSSLNKISTLAATPQQARQQQKMSQS